MNKNSSDTVISKKFITIIIMLLLTGITVAAVLTGAGRRNVQPEIPVNAESVETGSSSEESTSASDTSDDADDTDDADDDEKEFVPKNNSNKEPSGSVITETVASESTKKENTTSEAKKYTITFETNGGSAAEPIKLAAGSAMGELPTPKKDGYIFIAWCYDPELTNIVETDDVLTGNFTLYAKYQPAGQLKQMSVDIIASALDQPADFCLEITTLQEMDAATVKSLITAANLASPEQGTDDIVEVTGSGTSFTVKGKGGFEAGASYRLTLDDNRLNFADQDASVREYTFTIYKDEVVNAEINKDITYLHVTSVSNLTVNGQAITDKDFDIDIITIGPDGAKTEEGKVSTGTFTCTSKTFGAGDIVGIYDGLAPDTNVISVENNVSYVEITAAEGSNYTFSGATATDVLFIPDVLPVSAAADTDGDAQNNSITVALSAMDYSDSKYQQMNLDEDTEVEPGDYIAVYSGDLANGNVEYYAEIITVTTASDQYIITFEKVTLDQLMSAMDVYSTKSIDGGLLLTEEEKQNIKNSIEQQALESGFVAEAAYELTAATIATDEFTQLAGRAVSIDQVDFSDSPVMLKQLGNSGASSLAEESKVTVTNVNATADIWTSLKHFEGEDGVRLMLKLSFDINIEVGDSYVLVVTVTSRFEQENSLSVNLNAEAVWGKAWIIPYIADVKVVGSTDNYNFTAVSIDAAVKCKPKLGGIPLEWKDIENYGNYIKDALESPDPVILDDIVLGKDGINYTVAQTLGEKYNYMLGHKTEWFNIYEKELIDHSIRLMYVVDVNINLKANVTANMNIFLRADLWQEDAKRNTFTFKLSAMEMTSDVIAISPEKYEISICAMGTLGIRAGITLSVRVGVISAEMASAGVSIDTGLYTRVWGYLYYKYTYEENVGRDTLFTGAMYLEFGAYLKVYMVMGTCAEEFMFRPVLYNKEFELLSAGDLENHVDFAYTQTDADHIRLKGENRSVKVSDDMFYTHYMNMKTGLDKNKQYFVDTDYVKGDFAFEVTSDAFTFNPDTKMVTVTPKEGNMEENGELIITYTGEPTAFSTKPIQRRIPLHWDCYNDKYSIVFDSNGGSYVDAVFAPYKEAVTKPEDPVRQGYSFGGWYKDRDCTVSYTIPETMPAEDVTCYAKWTPEQNTYMVEHYIQDLGSTNYTLHSTVTHNALTESEASGELLEIEGFTAPEAQKITVAASGNSTIRYYYTRNSYTATLCADNGEENVVLNILYGDEVVPAPVLKKEYLFVGWYTDEQCTADYEIPGKMPAENITLYAKWVSLKNSYIVKHYIQNAEGTGYDLYKTVTDQALKETEITGALLEIEGFTAPEPQTVTVQPDATVTISYYYTRNFYEIKYNVNNSWATQQFRHGAVVNLPTPEAAHYTFEGWYLDSEFTNMFDGIMPLGDAAVYAKMVENLYTLSYAADGTETSGTAPQDTVKDVSYFKDVTLAQNSGNLARTGYTCVGWTTVKGGEKMYDFGATVNSIAPQNDTTMVLYPAWAPISYTIVYSAEGAISGEPPQSVTVYYDQQVTLAENTNTMVKKWHNCIGWTPDVSSVKKYALGETVTNLTAVNGATVTLYPIWQPISYTITFVNSLVPAETPSPQTVAYPETITLPTYEFTIEGYTFEGWTDGKDTYPGGSVYPSSGDSTVIPEYKDVTLTAVWKPSSITPVQ